MQHTDSLRDEIRLQHQKLNDQPFSKKMEYYWHYYKVHTIVIVLLALMFGSILHTIITQKETVLSIAYINAFPNVDDETFIDDFENDLNLNPKKQQVMLDSSYYIDDDSTSPYAATYSQKFSANAMAGNLDVVLADASNFDFYSQQGFFQNLENVLSKELFAKYEKDFYYVDISNDASSEKIPVGIKIDQASKIVSTASYVNTDAYFGIVTGTENVETALRYLDFLEQ